MPRPFAAAVSGFGAAGLLLAVVLILALAQLAGTAGSLAHEQQGLIQLTESSRIAAIDGQAAAQRAEAGVTAAADASDRASAFIGELATALRATAASLRVDLFGSQPFAGAADNVARAADQADRTATGLTQAANEARAGAAQLHSVTADLGTIANDMTGIGNGLAPGGGLDNASLTVLEVALIGLMVWLAIPAAVCLWLGFTVFRRPASRPRSAARQEPVR
jgi:hypothetical protein